MSRSHRVRRNGLLSHPRGQSQHSGRGPLEDGAGSASVSAGGRPVLFLSDIDRMSECLLQPPSGSKLKDRFHHSSSYSVCCLCCLSLLLHLMWLDRLPAHLVTETGRPMSLPVLLPLPLPPFFNSCSSMKIGPQRDDSSVRL